MPRYVFFGPPQRRAHSQTIRYTHMNAFTTHATHTSYAVRSVNRKYQRRGTDRGDIVVSSRSEKSVAHGADKRATLLKKMEFSGRVWLSGHDDKRGPRYRFDPENPLNTRMIEAVLFAVNLFCYYWCIGAYTILYFSACYYVGEFFGNSII